MVYIHNTITDSLASTLSRALATPSRALKNVTYCRFLVYNTMCVCACVRACMRMHRHRCVVGVLRTMDTKKPSVYACVYMQIY